MFLYQHVKDKTRYRQGQTPNTLDLIITNEPDVIEAVVLEPSLGKSDHVCIVFSYVMEVEYNVSESVKLNYWKGEYSKICSDLATGIYCLRISV